jgi:hypothetical protein
MISTIKHFSCTENGIVETHTEEIEVPDVDIEQQIKDKEQQMLELYEEIKRLKGE